MAKIRGWYYDKQLDSPLTSATLHANMWWKADNEDGDGGKFINWDQIKGENGFGPNQNKTDHDKYETILGTDKNACGYGIDPICTSILNEDFNVAISNTWSEFGGDPIGEAYNNMRGPMAAVAQPIIDSLKTLIANNKATQNDGQPDGRGATIMQKAINGLDEAIQWVQRKSENDIVEFLNKALVTNGTRFSYYGGTGIAFGNLGMKFTIFPKWDDQKFLDVPSQVVKLYPYFIGQMEDFKKATGWQSTNADVNEALEKVFMFQNPPGGYRANMQGIDKIQRGTLKLKIGSYYEITNLVCSDVMLNFSKNMVKDPTTQEVSPLFCDVAITLRPSTKYSDKMLRNFVGGSGAAKKAITTIIKENLKNERTSLKNTIDSNEPNYMIDQDV